VKARARASHSSVGSRRQKQHTWPLRLDNHSRDPRVAYSTVTISHEERGEISLELGRERGEKGPGNKEIPSWGGNDQRKGCSGCGLIQGNFLTARGVRGESDYPQTSQAASSKYQIP